MFNCCIAFQRNENGHQDESIDKYEMKEMEKGDDLN